MKDEFFEEVKRLVQQAHKAGHLAACWEDGGWPSNDDYYKSEEDLTVAMEKFLEKYDDKITNKCK